MARSWIRTDTGRPRSITSPRCRMELKLVLFLVFLTFKPHSAQVCTTSKYCQILIWAKWSSCSSGCGQGIRYRLPGLCCPQGVTAKTIFEECAVKLCNMTESEYNQTDTCLSTDTCTTAPRDTTSATVFDTTTGETTSQVTSAPTDTTSQTIFGKPPLKTTSENRTVYYFYKSFNRETTSARRSTVPTTREKKEQGTSVNRVTTVRWPMTLSTDGSTAQDKLVFQKATKLHLPEPFGLVTLLVISTLLVAALTSCAGCVVFAAKRRRDRKRKNSVQPYNTRCMDE